MHSHELADALEQFGSRVASALGHHAPATHIGLSVRVRDNLVAHRLKRLALRCHERAALLLSDGLDLLDRLDHVAEVLKRHVAVRHAQHLVQDDFRDLEVDAEFQLRLEPFREFRARVGVAQRHLPQLEPLEDALDLVGGLRAHALAVVVVQDVAQVLDRLADLLERLRGLSRQLVLHDLPAGRIDHHLVRVRRAVPGGVLGVPRRRLCLSVRLSRRSLRYGLRLCHGPCGHRRQQLAVYAGVGGLGDLLWRAALVVRHLRIPCGAGLCDRVLAGSDVPDPSRPEDRGRCLPSRRQHDAHRLLGLGLELVLHHEEPGARLVVERLLDRLLAGLVRVQVAVRLDHPLVGGRVNLVLDWLRVQQRANQVVTGCVPEDFGDEVWVHAVDAHHATAARAEARDVRPVLHALWVHGLDRLEVEPVGADGLDSRAVRVGRVAGAQVRHRTVDGAPSHLLLNLSAHLRAEQVVLCLHAAQHARARIAQPLHDAEAALLEFADALLHGKACAGLILGPLLRAEAGGHRLLLAHVQRNHVAHGLRPRNLVRAREERVEDLTHLASQHRQVATELLAVDRVEVGLDRRVHLAQHAREVLERRLHLEAGRAALKHVDLEVVRELLVVRPLLLERHRVPVCEPLLWRRSSDAEPEQHDVHALLHLWRRARAFRNR